MTRCTSCYRPLDAAHRLLGRCLAPDTEARPARRSTWTPPAGYRPPSRSHMQSREEYLESVRVDPEVRKANRRKWEAGYRARRRAAAK